MGALKRPPSSRILGRWEMETLLPMTAEPLLPACEPQNWDSDPVPAATTPMPPMQGWGPALEQGCGRGCTLAGGHSGQRAHWGTNERLAACRVRGRRCLQRRGFLERKSGHPISLLGTSKRHSSLTYTSTTVPLPFIYLKLGSPLPNGEGQRKGHKRWPGCVETSSVLSCLCGPKAPGGNCKGYHQQPYEIKE